jgi:hypothetical protein
MPSHAPVAKLQELRERVAHLFALALRARENGNIELAEQLVNMALLSEDVALRMENAATLKTE